MIDKKFHYQITLNWFEHLHYIFEIPDIPHFTLASSDVLFPKYIVKIFLIFEFYLVIQDGFSSNKHQINQR